MNKDQIKHMVDRFLMWRLPSNFAPDAGISYTRPNYHPSVDATPTGTNLFDATQPDAMVRHMVEGLAAPHSDTLAELLAEAEFLVDRLQELEWSGDYECTSREYHGHVAPSVSRLTTALAALAEGRAEKTPEEWPDAAVERARDAYRKSLREQAARPAVDGRLVVSAAVAMRTALKAAAKKDAR